ncbi:hypothetical protein AKO1_005440 [Acrasis kona]
MIDASLGPPPQTSEEDPFLNKSQFPLKGFNISSIQFGDVPRNNQHSTNRSHPIIILNVQPSNNHPSHVRTNSGSLQPAQYVLRQESCESLLREGLLRDEPQSHPTNMDAHPQYTFKQERHKRQRSFEQEPCVYEMKRCKIDPPAPSITIEPPQDQLLNKLNSICSSVDRQFSPLLSPLSISSVHQQMFEDFMTQPSTPTSDLKLLEYYNSLFTNVPPPQLSAISRNEQIL